METNESQMQDADIVSKADVNLMEDPADRNLCESCA